MTARIYQWRELERWLPGGESEWEAAFPLVSLGDFLRRVVRPIDKSERPLESLNVIEKISFGGKLHVRGAEKIRGYKGPLFQALPGELIISKIRVAQGSLCVVPDSLDHLAVSAEYPTYKPDLKQVRARYLNLILRTPNFQSLLCSTTSGNTTKKRLRPEDFEQVEIPLPEPDEQDKLLAGFDKTLGKVAKLEADAAALECRAIQEFEAALGLVPSPDLPRRPFQIAQFSNMDRWSHECVLQNSLRSSTTDSTLATVALGDYVEVTHGCGASPSPRPTGLEVLKISAATRGELRPSEKKFAFDRAEFRRRFDLRRGDVLLCRVNGTLGYVGMSAMVEEDMPDMIFPDKLIRVRVKDAALLPDFLWRLLQLPNMRVQIESYARTAVGNYAIGSTDVTEFQIPLPAIETQRSLTKKLREARIRAAAKRAEAARLRSEAWADFLGAIFN